jgi:nitroreductase
MKLNLSVDEVLTTTRTVRKRLDVSRPVPRALLEECLEIALQAPNGSNRNEWRWILTDDPAVIARLAAEYRAGLAALWEDQRKGEIQILADVPHQEKMLASSEALIEKLDRVPAMLIPLAPGRLDGASALIQTVAWGSLLPAVWSFMLALRERGVGAAWTTVTLRREREVAEILGVPYEAYTQAGLFPIAYTEGTEFRKAWRKPLAEVLSWNRLA